MIFLRMHRRNIFKNIASYKSSKKVTICHNALRNCYINTLFYNFFCTQSKNNNNQHHVRVIMLAGEQLLNAGGI